MWSYWYVSWLGHESRRQCVWGCHNRKGRCPEDIHSGCPKLVGTNCPRSRELLTLHYITKLEELWLQRSTGPGKDHVVEFGSFLLRIAFVILTTKTSMALVDMITFCPANLNRNVDKLKWYSTRGDWRINQRKEWSKAWGWKDEERR